jgi:hypothetical protein
MLNSSTASTSLDPVSIVRRSVMANQSDWRAAPEFAYTERIQDDDGAKTYDVKMLQGTPYKLLMAVDDHRLSPADQRSEQKKFIQERERRLAESPDERAQRIADYAKNLRAARDIIDELPRAFSYRLRSSRNVAGRTVYVLEALPAKGYKPSSRTAEALTGMHGEFWIDAATFQWVRASVSVLNPVSIFGFLARVEPGTRFVVEQKPVDHNVWLPSRLEIHSRSSLVFLLHHHRSETRTFFNYRKVPTS